MPLLETRGAASVQGFGSLAASARNYIEDVFSTYLYTGNGSTQTITNGIDLSGKGGLVWIKRRDAISDHRFTDTLRGTTKVLSSNNTSAEVTDTNGLTAFGSTSFTIGSDSGYNLNSSTYVSWTFRKQAKFFDVVTFTTDSGGQASNIAHSLGSVPGCILIKRTSGAQDWKVYHRSLTVPTGRYLELNSTVAEVNPSETWISVTSTTIGFPGTRLDGSSNYVAYLFAHDAGGFGASGSDNVITCGSYTGNGSATGPTVTLGYEPQWLLIKRATGAAGRWLLMDSMRGFVVGGTDNLLEPQDAAAENGGYGAGNWVDPTATGFNIVTSTGGFNANGDTYIYIAIRRGPMKTPTTGTSVYTSASRTGTASVIPRFTSNFVVDWALRKSDVTAGGGDWQAGDRLRGGVQVKPNLTEAETAAATLYTFDSMTGYSTLGAVGSDTADRSWMFRRAPGFFDEVCYTGNGNNSNNVSHNLTKIPELIIVKSRSGAYSWCANTLNNGSYVSRLLLNSTVSESDVSVYDNGYIISATSTTFLPRGVSTYDNVNRTSATYVAYLFATCPGVSKVGSYTGTGNTLQIDCGFTGGARFVLIKRTDSTGDWYVWDSARGIVAGNDPYLLLNSTAAEVTSTDYVDTYSAGFEISSTAPAAINANGGSFIFLAIA